MHPYTENIILKTTFQASDKFKKHVVSANVIPNTVPNYVCQIDQGLHTPYIKHMKDIKDMKYKNLKLQLCYLYTKLTSYVDTFQHKSAGITHWQKWYKTTYKQQYKIHKHYITPVSYTHLDVYKRQAMNTSGSTEKIEHPVSEIIE